MTAKVLALPELLENILLRLHVKDLLFAQRVCKTWKQVIEGSPSIQRSLFFLPGTIGDVDPHSFRWLGSYIRYKPFSGAPYDVARNPLFGTNEQSSSSWCPRSCGPSIISPELLHAEPYASCHRMYLTQPPTLMETHIRDVWPPNEEEFWGEWTPENPGLFYVGLLVSNGGTFGELAKDYRKQAIEQEAEGHSRQEADMYLLIGKGDYYTRSPLISLVPTEDLGVLSLAASNIERTAEAAGIGPFVDMVRMILSFFLGGGPGSHLQRQGVDVA
ncbi:hypothetical protein LTR97_006969 [Elasticomyces elasticus]|uniref:F-box domain-containing protein n=1 Tax=Elasticomyces elasticus TaxID=574655 RepID=A0AAN8A0D7_9PEZI|nr:hypothetical protein LTR97_006969 [Elasticomyces elasticus]